MYCLDSGQVFPGSEKLSSSGPLGGLETEIPGERDVANKVVARLQGG